MQVVGFLLIALGVWSGYCAVESFNPLALLLAIISSPESASSIIAGAKQNRSITANSGSSSGGSQSATATAPTGGNYSTFSQFPIACSFACHVARNSSAPGIDFSMPVGTPLYSPFSGIVTNSPNINPLAGNQIQVHMDNGDVMQIDHVSGFIDSLNGKRISAGDLIGYSGGKQHAPGAGDSSGPHAHVDVRTSTGQYVPFNTLLPAPSTFPQTVRIR